MIGPEIAVARDAALALSRTGKQCFPCLVDKSPASPHGFKDATADPEKLRAILDDIERRSGLEESAFLPRTLVVAMAMAR